MCTNRRHLVNNNPNNSLRKWSVAFERPSECSFIPLTNATTKQINHYDGLTPVDLFVVNNRLNADVIYKKSEAVRAIALIASYAACVLSITDILVKKLLYAGTGCDHVGPPEAVFI